MTFCDVCTYFQDIMRYPSIAVCQLAWGITSKPGQLANQITACIIITSLSTTEQLSHYLLLNQDWTSS